MKSIAIVLGMMLIVISGCAFFEGMLGIDKTPTSGQQGGADQMIGVLDKAVKDGVIDINTAKLIVESIREESNKNKTPWWEELLYMVGVAAGTYLGTRKIRTSLSSKT